MNQSFLLFKIQVSENVNDETSKCSNTSDEDKGKVEVNKIMNQRKTN